MGGGGGYPPFGGKFTYVLPSAIHNVIFISHKMIWDFMKNGVNPSEIETQTYVSGTNYLKELSDFL